MQNKPIKVSPAYLAYQVQLYMHAKPIRFSLCAYLAYKVQPYMHTKLIQFTCMCKVSLLSSALHAYLAYKGSALYA